MSKGLCPSKSTIYVSNLPFSLTNNDLHKIFEKYGKVVKVTVMKDRHTRRSRGVAFVLYLDRDSAHRAVRALHKTQMFERTIKCTIAKDNGRAPEFIRRKEYKDKTKCYECGDSGHLSYRCPKNLLGEREPPPKKKKLKKGQKGDDGEEVEGGVSNEDSETEDTSGLDSLAAAIQFQRQMMEDEEGRFGQSSASTSDEPRRKRYKKDAYFSDEEELDD
ncbi:zinc finger CCHC-type and RNA-binding motif-containing protein 1-like [Babylonia areolata]|uniref:zinc finger CCHC-type and RNA-binding motif-containing protein 1-like n=1 Tax=Babylonia areolata TaxID=304850 RepID=UPI003FD5C2C9